MSKVLPRGHARGDLRPDVSTSQRQFPLCKEKFPVC